MREIYALLAAVAWTASPSSAFASATYTYDELGRVTTGLYDNGTCVAYLYDAVGNRTAVSVTLAGTPVSPEWGSGTWGCFPWTLQSARLTKTGPPIARTAVAPADGGGNLVRPYRGGATRNSLVGRGD